MKLKVASAFILLLSLSACSSSNIDEGGELSPELGQAQVESDALAELPPNVPDQDVSIDELSLELEQAQVESDALAELPPNVPDQGVSIDELSLELEQAQVESDALAELTPNVPDQDASISDSENIVILASGQSNIARHHDYNWSPPENLKVWNLHRINEGYGSTDQDVGSSFEHWQGNEITVSVAYAAEVAQQNPDKQVRLISIAWGGKSIDHWIDRATPDIYSMVRLNVGTALTHLPTGSEINEFLWWQGESDENPYLDRYLQMEQKFRAQQHWFNFKTKIILITPNPSGNGGFRRFNDIAQSLFVASLHAPSHRVTFVPSAYEFEDGIHLDVDQFFKFSRDLKRYVDDRFY